MSSILNGKASMGVLVSAPAGVAMPVAEPPATRPPMNPAHAPGVPPESPAGPAVYLPAVIGAGTASLVVAIVLWLAATHLGRPDAEPVEAVDPAPSGASAPAAPSKPPIALASSAKALLPPSPKISPTVPATPAPAVKGGEAPADIAAPKLPPAPPIDAGDIAKAEGKPIPPGADELPGALPKCETYGTAINFVRSPLVAAKHAHVEDKLVFTLHVSGNFEDPGFT